MSWERALAVVAAIGAAVLLVGHVQDGNWLMVAVAVAVAVVVLVGMGWWAVRADGR